MAVLTRASIAEHFQTVEKPRIERTKKHTLLNILVITVCTLLTGGEGFQDMELFGKSKRAGHSYEFGDRVKPNKVSKRPLTQASLRCTS